MILSDEELIKLIPTVQLKGEAPVTMVWMKQASCMQAMRNLEAVLEERIREQQKYVIQLEEMLRDYV